MAGGGFGADTVVSGFGKTTISPRSEIRKEAHMPVGSIGGGITTTKISTDPRDLNQDGKVTEAEIQAYARKHPEQTQQEVVARATQPTANSLSSGSNLLDLVV
jgi:hypothetical protein